MTSELIYLDSHATTPTDPRVVEEMLPYFTQQFGNSGSLHEIGRASAQAVETSREQIAAAIGAEAKEIIFTSGATESNNLAIKGVALRSRRRGNHLISVQTEHRAVLDPLRQLEKQGYELTLLSVDAEGFISLEELEAALREDTALVSVMLANNEIGTIQPIEQIGRVCRERKIPLHCDATQAVGKMPVDVEKLHVDLLSFTSHKLYGPPGVGALFVRKKAPRVRLEPQIAGGGQQGGLRSGTLPMPLIVGFAAAVRICCEEMPSEMPRQQALRDRLWELLLTKIDRIGLNGPPLDDPSKRLRHNLNVHFHQVQGDSLLLQLDRLAVSTGSACSAADPEPSHVLRALGLDEDLVRSSLRFGLSRFTTVEEIEQTASWVAEAVRQLRSLVTR